MKPGRYYKHKLLDYEVIYCITNNKFICLDDGKEIAGYMVNKPYTKRFYKWIKDPEQIKTLERKRLLLNV